MSEPNNGTYQSCACEWKDGKVISFCAAHSEAADDRARREVWGVVAAARKGLK